VSTLKGRMGKVMDTLTAQERAALFARRFKEGLKSDLEERAPMSPSEEQTLARLVKMITSANSNVALMLQTLEEQVNSVGYLVLALLPMEAMRKALLACSEVFVSGTEELLTETEYAERKKKAKRRRVKPEWARAIRIVSDAEYEAVEVSRTARDYARAYLETMSRHLGGLEDAHHAGGMREVFEQQLTSAMCSAWMDMRTIEVGLQDLQSELGGEDPLAEKHREVLTGCRTRLEGLHEIAEELLVTIELPQPQPAGRKLIWDLLKLG